MSKHTIKVFPSQGSASGGTCLPFPISFLFYLTQFLFNFFKYSSSNLLLSHPNTILTIYFPSNSLLLNSSASRFNSPSITFCSSFLFFICHISSFLIYFSNFFTKSIIFFKFSNLSQVSSSAV